MQDLDADAGRTSRQSFSSVGRANWASSVETQEDSWERTRVRETEKKNNHFSH
jgi:hypothetical protein